MRLAWDAVALLAAWLVELGALPWELVVAPTPSRGRSLRNLTVNVFHPFELLPSAWATRDFPWDPDLDAEREAAFADTAGLAAWAGGVLAAWRLFVAAEEDAVGEDIPEIASPRGAIRWTALLASQRWHAAFHLRQLEHVLALGGREPAGSFRSESLADLDLPAEVW